MELMGREQVRRIPIVDERGALVGVVAQADSCGMSGKDKQAEKAVEQISQSGRQSPDLTWPTPGPARLVSPGARAARGCRGRGAPGPVPVHPASGRLTAALGRA